MHDKYGNGLTTLSEEMRLVYKLVISERFPFVIRHLVEFIEAKFFEFVHNTEKSKINIGQLTDRKDDLYHIRVMPLCLQYSQFVAS